MQWSPFNTCVSTDRSLGFISHLVGYLGSRMGYSLSWPIRGGPARNGYLFKASGIWKGKDFTLSSIQKGREICRLGLLKSPKGLTDEFYGFIKSRKRLDLLIDSHSNDSAFTAIKRNAKFYTRYMKEMLYHLSIEGIRKDSFFVKNGV